MSVVEKGLALAEVVVVGIAKVVWSIVWGTAKFLVSRELWLDPVGANSGGDREAEDTTEADNMMFRALSGDPIARYHPAYRAREAG